MATSDEDHDTHEAEGDDSVQAPQFPALPIHSYQHYLQQLVSLPTFEVYVAKETFKFNAAHFVAYRGFRERLHGHNYTASIKLYGSSPRIGADGYVIDFTMIKKVMKAVCKDLNEHFLCPVYSNVLVITKRTVTGAVQDRQLEQIHISCEDGSEFVFPAQDCAMLPLVHATAEELAMYLWNTVLEQLSPSYLLQRNLHTMEITVAEAPGQQATFRYPIAAPMPCQGAKPVVSPTDQDNVATALPRANSHPIDIRQFVCMGQVIPKPCLPAREESVAEG
jgi:dihydroneopterin triphosphate aldolase (PTPS-III) / 6-pyruvoyltetrahydropterin synthase